DGNRQPQQRSPGSTRDRYGVHCQPGSVIDAGTERRVDQAAVDERFADRGSEVGFRVRPLVRYNHRIGRDGWAVFVSHESFYLPNTTDAGQRRGYERMRNIAGVAVPLGKRMIADVGYLNQYRFGRGGARAQMDHALTVQLTINLQSFRVPRVND
ncbi:MAG: DUF2490 domain-containing protein, partial [Sphingomonas sp.]